MSRLHHDLGGLWQIALDPCNVGKREGWHLRGLPSSARATPVPSVWNLSFPGYEGVVFYAREFAAAGAWQGRSARLRVGAANYLSEWWLNGHFLGAHEGGYTPFWFDVSAALRYGEANRLVARVVDLPLAGEVDGLRLREVACAKETWYYRYGGIWGAVALEVGDSLWCADVFVQPAIDPPAARVQVALRNELPFPRRAQVRVAVGNQAGRLQQEWSWQGDLLPGSSLVEGHLLLPEARLWTLDQPALYHCRVEVARDGRVVDAAETTFGLRQVAVRDGEFYLNGSPLFLKGVLYQPNYPRTLAYPPTADLPAREMQLIKDAGFNLVRFHLRPPPAAYLDLADRLGLLLYEETALGWIAESPRLRERCESEIRETIRRDRNHPSVALWGLFNENREQARRLGRHLLHYARAHDPTRPIVDNSGGTAAVDPEGGWCDRTLVLSPGATVAAPLADLHLYLVAPAGDDLYRWLAGFGNAGRLPSLVQLGYATPAALRALGRALESALGPARARAGKMLVSEFGYGGLPDLTAVAAPFAADALIDAQEVRAYRDLLAAGLAARGLTEMLGGSAGLAVAAQRLQARGNRRQAEALRRNPRVGGYVLTQFNDAAWEMGAGIVDLWRQPKLAYGEMARANAPSMLVVQPHPRVQQARGRIALEIGILSDVPVRAGRLAVQVQAAGGTLVLQRTFDVTCGGYAARGEGRYRRLTTARPRLPAPGSYTIQARFDIIGGAVLEATAAVLVVPAVDRAALAEAVSVPPAATLLAEWLGSAALIGPQDGRVLVVPARANQAGALAVAVDFATAGGAAVLCELAEPAAQTLSRLPRFGRSLSTFGSRGLYVGCFHYVRPGPAFAGLPQGCLAAEEYAGVLPYRSLSELEGDILGGCLTHLPYYAGRPGLRWGADLQIVRCGQGRLALCQYRLLSQLGRDVAAELLLRNVVALVGGEAMPD